MSFSTVPLPTPTPTPRHKSEQRAQVKGFKSGPVKPPSFRAPANIPIGVLGWKKRNQLPRVLMCTNTQFASLHRSGEA